MQESHTTTPSRSRHPSQRNSTVGGNGGPSRGQHRGRQTGQRRRRERFNRGESARPEHEQRVVDIRRVARVIAGGRRFSFSATVIIGNQNGAVGVGLGKGSDTATAIEKAVRDAKKNLITVPRIKSHSIAHEVQAKYCGSEVYIRPAAGKGLVAGSSARVVLNLAGITDTSAKLLSRSKNSLNNARATIAALQKLSG